VRPRFRARAVFESDTDSAAERAAGRRAPGQQDASRRPGRKQLISETKYSATTEEPGAAKESAGGASRGKGAPLQPSWDYSLKVNRVKDRKVHSTVR